MEFNKSNCNVKFKVVGYKENAGEFNGKRFHNYIIYGVQPVNGGKGVCGLEMTLTDDLGIHPDRLFNKDVYVEFNYYKDNKRQRIGSVKIVD